MAQKSLYKPGFYSGEWGSGNDPYIFAIYPTGADATYFDGSKFWWCPPEVMWDKFDKRDRIRELCLELIRQEIEPSDKLLFKELF